MIHYVALLRGIAPMNPNMRNDKLRSVFESMGFTNVRSVIASGNILFDANTSDTAALEEKLDAAWQKQLGFSSTTIIRSLKELRELAAKDPFRGKVHSRDTSLNITFLKRRPAAHIKPPQGAYYQIMAVYPQEICSLIDTTGTKTPDFMAKTERLYGKEITTRTWKTVQRIIAKLEEQA